MKLNALIFIATVGLLVPVLWITGTMASFIYYLCLHGGRRAMDNGNNPVGDEMRRVKSSWTSIEERS